MALPAGLQGKTLWLRGKDLTGADGSTVSAWADQSGAGHDASVTGTNASRKVLVGATPSGGTALRLTTGTVGLPYPLHPVSTTQVVVSSQYNAGYRGDFLVDGVLDGGQVGWASKGIPTVAAPQWARLELAAPKAVSQYRVYRIPGTVNRAPKDFTFEGAMSPDGPWIVLDTQVGVSWLTADASKMFAFSNPTAYQHYRLHCTATQGGDLLHLAELVLDEEPNGDSASPGELWMVLRSTAAANGISSTRAWALGRGSGGNYYSWTDGQIFDDFLNGTRRSFMPNVDISMWRLLRITLDAAGTLTYRLDEATQASFLGVAGAWPTSPLLANNAYLDIAEALLLTKPASPSQVGNLIAHFNAEHGLAVPGGVEPVIPAVRGIGRVRLRARGNTTFIAGAPVASGAGRIRLSAGAPASNTGPQRGAGRLRLSSGHMLARPGSRYFALPISGDAGAISLDFSVPRNDPEDLSGFSDYGAENGARSLHLEYTPGRDMLQTFRTLAAFQVVISLLYDADRRGIMDGREYYLPVGPMGEDIASRIGSVEYALTAGYPLLIKVTPVKRANNANSTTFAWGPVAAIGVGGIRLRAGGRAQTIRSATGRGRITLRSRSVTEASPEVVGRGHIRLAARAKATGGIILVPGGGRLQISSGTQLARDGSLWLPFVMAGSGSRAVDFSYVPTAPEILDPWVVDGEVASNSLWFTVGGAGAKVLTFTPSLPFSYAIEVRSGGDATDLAALTLLAYAIDQPIEVAVADGQDVLVRVHPMAASQTGVGTVSWGVVDRPDSGILQLECSATLEQAGWLLVNVVSAAPMAQLDFTLDGATTVVHADAADELGIFSGAVLIPDTTGVGAHTLTVTDRISGQTASAPFTVLSAAEIPAPLPVDLGPATPAVPDPVIKWVFEDRAPGGLGSYTLPINPSSMSSPHFTRTLTPDHAMAPGGQSITWEGVAEPANWQVEGSVETQTHFETLEAYYGIRRRFYVIDHLQRAWVVSFESLEFTKKDSINDWAYSYTAKFLIVDGPKRLA